MNPAVKFPSTATINAGTRAFSIASRPSTSFGAKTTHNSRIEHKAVSWLNAQIPTTTTCLFQHQLRRQQLQRQSQKHFGAALFSTSSTAYSSKEEEDLYQALTASFRTRLAEQVHKPEDDYKAVIENWTAHTQKDHLIRQRTRSRKERLAAAIKHKDITWIQKEQERLELEANGTSDDHFYVIQAWIKCGELKRATIAFEKMESMGIPLTVRTLAAMIRAHSRSGNLSVAGAMVQKIRDYNLKPTSIYDLSALLEFYIKLATPSNSTSTPNTTTISQTIDPDPMYKANRERVENVWKAIEPQIRLGISAAANNNASFSYRTYLIFLVEKAQDFEHAAEIIDKMTARNISPELERYQKTACSIIQRLASHGYLTEVQLLLDQNDSKLAKVLPQLQWSELMEAYVSRGEDQKARWIYNDMIRYGIQPNSRCKKIYSELQLKGGTTDSREPGSGSGTTKRNENIMSILFNRQQKPILSS
ncbi:hypothetical protein BGZ76_011006 [Entomortierella beljakovae]|nr:hypothetical protein BGZ76_011006 [Entomortierella beljakovae]